jgi:hypothetical protein
VKSVALPCLLVSLGASALGCSGGDAGSATQAPPSASLLTAPLGELPSKLSEVGLYRGAELDAQAPALAYEPGYPLWSDGGDKRRAIVLPEGASIDDSDPENYLMPLGTLIFKTFAFRTPHSPDAAVPVETRLLRLKDDGWELAAWAWDDDGRDAQLLDLRKSQTRDVLDDDGNVVAHAIPSRLECRQCHESSTSEVLGINELQLAKSGSLGELAPRITPKPRQPYAALPEHGPLTSSVLAYFVGNCVHLRPDVALANLIDQPTASSATADGIRIAPGKPDESILYLAVTGTGALEVKDMPPLSVASRDQSAINLLSDWISALATDPDP